VSPTVTSGLIFLSVSVSIAVGFHLLSGVLGRDRRKLRERVEEEFQSPTPTEGPRNILLKNLDSLTLQSPEWSPAPDGVQESGFPLPAPSPRGIQGALAKSLEQLNWSIKPIQFLLGTVLIGFAFGIIGMLFIGPVVACLLAAAGLTFPFAFLFGRWKSRKEKLISQLPGAFDLMLRVLRAGQSVPQALQAVADTFDNPIATEFSRCQKMQNLGIQPEIAFQELAARCDVLELRIFAMAMLAQRQTGGNISEVLERLANLVRERLKLRRKVKALTAEGRLQAITLLVLPFLMFGVMMIINRDYAQELLHHTSLLVGMGVAMLFGAWWIRRIVNFEF
jgi:tight adherence protein B